MDKEKKIKEILKTEYKGKMSEQTLNEFANDLYLSVFVEQYDLDDVPAIVCEYESKANIEDSEWDYIFGCMVYLLDNNEETAKTLYRIFMHDYESFDVLIKLITENEEFLSEKQLSEVKEKAFGMFDKELLKSYGITE